MQKPNKHILILLALGLWLEVYSVSWGEQKPMSIIESLRKIQQPIEEKDDLTEVLNQAKSMMGEQTLGSDDKTAVVVNSLKNPFEPQLPKKPKEVAAPVIPPAPEPKDEPAPPPVNIPPPSRPEFTISGLVWNTDRPQAIVNGQVVAVGDSVEAWVITKISKQGVDVQQGEQIFTLNPGTLGDEPPEGNGTNSTKRTSTQIQPRAAQREQAVPQRPDSRSSQSKQPRRN